MQRAPHRAFTLIELLVVIAIIGVLAGVALPIYNNVQLSAKRVQSLSNLRQLSAAALSYCGDNNGLLPAQYTTSPAWGTTTADWYNVLPRTYMSSPNLSDYAANTAAFYAKGSVFYVPAANYKAGGTNPNGTPEFAVSFNSKLFVGGANNIRLQGFQLPSETVLFLESGANKSETPVVNSSQSAYNGQAYAFASRVIARYNGQTILTFVDGHAASLPGSAVVCPPGSSAGTPGKAYFPSPNPFPAGVPPIYWEQNPVSNPNN